MLSVCLLFSLLLLGVIQRCYSAGSAKIDDCSDVGQIRLTIGRGTVTVSGTVQGRIEICSNQSSSVYSWESLCDDNWTVEDVTVACRDLGYSVFNATRFFPDIHGKVQTGYAYNCSGSESRVADCRSHLTENCNSSIGVQCYNASSTTVSPNSSTTVSPNSSTMVSPNSSTMVSPNSSTTVSPSTIPSRLQPSSPSRYIHGTPTVHLVTQSPLLQGTSPSKTLYPIYIYATIGIVTVLLLVIVGIVIMAIIMCRRSARKQLTSPQFAQNNDYVPEEESLYSNSKDHTMIEQTHEIIQHHIYHEVAAPALHVYEDIKPNAKAQHEQEGDYASLDRSTSLKDPHNSDSTGNRESTTLQQQHSYSRLNHNESPPVKGKPCVPHAVNQLSFLMSPTKTNLEDSTDDRFSSDSNKTSINAASNGVYGEWCGNHVYAVLEDPSKCHTKSTSAVHYPPQGEVVGGHQYAILEAPTIPSHQATHQATHTGSTTLPFP